MPLQEKRFTWISLVYVAVVPCLVWLVQSASLVSEKPGIQTIFIPTRDGTLLATDLYFPLLSGKQLPAVLIRTPYSRRTYKEMGDYFSSKDFAVAIQDVRGRPTSGGKWEPGIHEGEDGYDAVEWLAAQGWSNGKVGTVGASYDGWSQFLTALAKPPHLVTMIANVPDAGPFHNFPYEYGVFFTYGAISWLESFGEGKLRQDPSWLSRLDTLPVADLMKKLCGKEDENYHRWIEHNSSDAYWEKIDYLDRLDKLKIPVYLQGGWFDTATNGVKLAYQRLQEAGNKDIGMIVGPWAHSAKSSTKLGGLDFGEAAGIDLYQLYSRWFDHWLKGIDNGIGKEPRVQLFLMGPNRWLRGEAYPLSRTVITEFYLASETGANTTKGDGRLQRNRPASGREFDSYTYDPGDPTPGVTSRMRQGGLKGYSAITSSRSDILVFDTAPLHEPLNIIGPISVKLFASTSARDTDWVAYLAALDESGTPVPLGRGMGILRARFRNSMHKPELLEKGKVYEYTIDLWQTGRQISKGWKLRLEISSAYAPTYSRNLNTGGHNETDTAFITAEQRIYHSMKYPSRLLLPLVDLRYFE